MSMLVHCVVCRRNARPNKLGTVKEDAFVVFFPLEVCAACADRLHGCLAEVLLTMRAGSDMTSEERIERFIHRLRTGRPLEGETPRQSVRSLLNELGIDPGEDTDGNRT